MRRANIRSMNGMSFRIDFIIALFLSLVPVLALVMAGAGFIKA